MVSYVHVCILGFIHGFIQDFINAFLKAPWLIHDFIHGSLAHTRLHTWLLGSYTISYNGFIYCTQPHLYFISISFMWVVVRMPTYFIICLGQHLKNGQNKDDDVTHFSFIVKLPCSFSLKKKKCWNWHKEAPPISLTGENACIYVSDESGALSLSVPGLELKSK
jgi:hypothetical protein